MPTKVCGSSAHLHWQRKQLRFCNIPTLLQLHRPITHCLNTGEPVFSSHTFVIVNIELHLKGKRFCLSQWFPWYGFLAIMLLPNTKNTSKGCARFCQWPSYGSFLVPLCDFFLFVLPTLKLVKSTLKLEKSTLMSIKSTLMSIKSTLKLVKSTLKLILPTLKLIFQTLQSWYYQL